MFYYLVTQALLNGIEKVWNVYFEKSYLCPSVLAIGVKKKLWKFVTVNVTFDFYMLRTVYISILVALTCFQGDTYQNIFFFHFKHVFLIRIWEVVLMIGGEGIKTRVNFN